MSHEEGQPVHGEGDEKYARLVEEIACREVIDEWINRLIQGGTEAAGPYPYDAWARLYFPEGREARGPYIITTPRNDAFKNRLLEQISAAWEGTSGDEGEVVHFGQWRYTWPPQHAAGGSGLADDGVSGVDALGSERPSVEGGLRTGDLPALPRAHQDDSRDAREDGRRDGRL